MALIHVLLQHNQTSLETVVIEDSSRPRICREEEKREGWVEEKGEEGREGRRGRRGKGKSKKEKRGREGRKDESKKEERRREVRKGRVRGATV